MPDGDLLRQLARANGIETDYWDIQGQHHEASSKTLRALLQALDVPAQNDDAMKASIAATEDRAWRLAPPVCVCWEDDISITISLTAHEASRPLRWHVVQEDGAVHKGDVAPGTLIVGESGTMRGEPRTRFRLTLPNLPLGYHRFRLERSSPTSDTMDIPLIVAPRRCYLPPHFDKQKYWGLSVQLYGLRSDRNFGVGDFSDLDELCAWASQRGADAVGLNPLHAGFSNAPERFSPYAPNSRLFLNPLYLDIAEIAEFQNAWDRDVSSKLIAAFASLRNMTLVAYAAVSRAKMEALGQLFAHFRSDVAQNSVHPLSMQFQAFRASGGESLQRLAAFEALAEAQGTYHWASWPPGLRDPTSPDVVQFAQAHGERVAFFEYLQWHADRQLSRVAARRDMKICLYGDLAVSSDSDGFDVWNDQTVFALEARIGAPPDPFNERGQEWGIVPLNPNALRETGFAYFSALLRANMRHFGALRIDHAMGLERLFWVPAGASPSEGAYVRYPREAMLAILALESNRNQCVVVGEDLGTVPEDFRPRMAEANVLSYRVLYFERDGAGYRSPRNYPNLAVACATTHDLPTLKGFWSAIDIRLRFELGRLTEQEFEQAQTERTTEKQALLQALAGEELIATSTAAEVDTLTPSLVQAIQVYLARSAAILFMAQMDDLAGENCQANLPGTHDEYPNWRRKIAKTLAQLAHDPEIAAMCEAIAQERRWRAHSPSR
jgi:(1->4)-alpha-D-glucan 1-alpha-D-glucosylmutase